VSGIYDITPFSALDYPNNLSAIVWFSGCNLRCRYCHNLEIVDGVGNLNEDTVLEFLNSRRNLLDGVVLSGGEATLYKSLLPLCTEIKKLGFKIKLDTNGTNPAILKSLIDYGLLDFIAVDFKAHRGIYEQITKSKNYYAENIKSIKIALKSNIEYQIRVTYHSELFLQTDIDKMFGILRDLGIKTESILLQKYRKPNKFDNELDDSLEYKIPVLCQK
jgi:pyruvate formate lyase activating enzyme